MSDKTHHEKDESEGSTKDGEELADERTSLADDRTEFAEDRTVMANERTFAGWMRTGLTSVGIGLGFNALFSTMEPNWLPKAIATAFITLGIYIFYEAQKNGCAVFKRLDAHDAEPLQGMNLRLIAAIMGIASFALIIGIWMMTVPSR
ncbi:YidH family protein [Parasphingorhabdus sp.]|uniref:YidH family protein n=1 Tax=Parasphingorhabdus sp. TaxID=2709688 RepID=UPI002F95516D